MSKYDKYKPSEIVWIGDVPGHWNLKRLKDLVNPKITDGPHETPELVDDEDSIPFVSAEAITENGINYELRGGNISKEQDKIYSQKCKPQRNDIFIVKSGSTTGRIGYVDTDLDFNIWSPLALVRSNKKTSTRFLFHFLSSDCIQRQIQNSWSFGTQPNIGMGVIERLEISIPEYDEQLTIANYLDLQTQKIDRLIANKKAQAEKLKELRQIEINNAVTKGLNPNAELKDSGIEWLGKIPKHWGVKRLKYSAFINQSVISEKTASDFILKYIDISNVNSIGEFIELQEMEFSEAPSRARRIPKHNSILLSTVRTYLRAIAFVQNPDDNLIASTGFAVIDANQILFNAEYLFYQMISHSLVERVIANSEGVSYPAISSTKLGEIKVLIPPIEEQTKIAHYLKQRTLALDQLIKNIDTQIEILQELRKIKIYEAVTGKIKISAYAEATA
jgi:type I restriction enzyme S subunit